MLWLRWVPCSPENPEEPEVHSHTPGAPIVPWRREDSGRDPLLPQVVPELHLFVAPSLHPRGWQRECRPGEASGSLGSVSRLRLLATPSVRRPAPRGLVWGLGAPHLGSPPGARRRHRGRAVSAVTPWPGPKVGGRVPAPLCTRVGLPRVWRPLGLWMGEGRDRRPRPVQATPHPRNAPGPEVTSVRRQPLWVAPLGASGCTSALGLACVPSSPAGSPLLSPPSVLHVGKCLLESSLKLSEPSMFKPPFRRLEILHRV